MAVQRLAGTLRRMRHLMFACAAMLAACSPTAEQPAGNATDDGPVATSTGTAPVDVAAPPAAMPPFKPAALGKPGGLDNDTIPVSEALQPDTSAQGAAQVVQRYYALIEAGRHAQAYALWAPGRAGMTRRQFVRSFDRYAEYHVNIGAPDDVEGAAGSRYVTVPVQPYGRLRDGNRPFDMRGTITLRRVADVPGSTSEQRRWHIERSDVRPLPGDAQRTPQPTSQSAQDDRPIVRYRCDDGIRLVARFDPDNDTVMVRRDGQRLATLRQQRAASGIWYRGNGYELRGKGRDMTWTARAAAPLSCRAMMP